MNPSERLLGPALLALTLSIAGCGGGAPFEMSPVSGKVTYADGSLIKADRIVVSFEPQGMATTGPQSPSAAQGDVNVADGTFAGLTTWKFQDGAVVGKHKVRVEAFQKGPGGVDIPSPVVSDKYSRGSTSPLEVEVKSGQNEPIVIKVEKNP